jgi:hypothetical protein
MKVASPKDEKPKQKFHHLEITPATNGGHIVEHHTEYHEKMAQHVFSPEEGDEMLKHVAKATGVQSDAFAKPEAEDETGGGIPEKA